MSWVYFPDWQACVEPNIEWFLRSQNIRSCTSSSILLKIEDSHEAVHICLKGLHFPGEPKKFPKLFDIRTKETDWHKIIENKSRQISELQAEIIYLRRELAKLR